MNIKNVIDLLIFQVCIFRQSLKLPSSLVAVRNLGRPTSFVFCACGFPIDVSTFHSLCTEHDMKFSYAVQHMFNESGNY